MNKETHETEMKFYGVAASSGISIGIACIIKKRDFVSTGILLKNDNEIKAEIEKFEKAIQSSVEDINKIKKNEDLKLNHEDIEILETHIEFLTDLQLKIDVCQEITDNRKNVTDAIIAVIHKNVQTLKNLDNEYLRARAADVQDIGERIIKNLSTEDKTQLHFQDNSIIIAEDILPTDAINFNMNGVIGFVTRGGGSTSHTAILAKSRNIPAVFGCGNELNHIMDHDVLIVDATKGLVIVNPNEHCIEEYKIKKSAFDQKQQFLRSMKDTVAQTNDGVKIELLANISGTEELEDSLEYGAAGAGLFRTELLFMNRSSLPTEEDQFEYYKQIAIKSKGKPISIRTIDIGGDKPLDYFKLPKEENPFLGYRGIRICLDRKDIFISQLKAILRASVFGNFKVMFPMISNIQELRLAKEILNDAKKELNENNIEFDQAIKVGMMIEVPSAAITADILAKEVDFFSIGTNDLCQYTLAVDRGNEKVKEWYNPFDPAVLRLISYVIEQADKQKISVSMCGELASDPHATMLLMGMGLKDFSMNAASIPLIKNVIINTSFSRAKEVCSDVLEMDNSISIKDYLQLQK